MSTPPPNVNLAPRRRHPVAILAWEKPGKKAHWVAVDQGHVPEAGEKFSGDGRERTFCHRIDATKLRRITPDERRGLDDPDMCKFCDA